MQRLLLAGMNIVLLISLCSVPAFSQNEELKNSIIEQRIEEIAGTLDEGQELDYTNLFEDLTYYFEHPLNLNSANAEELRELQLLTDVQIYSLFAHINRYGPLRSIYELQAITGFDLPTIRSISYFVDVQPTLSLKDFSLRDFFNEGSHDLFLRYRRNIEEQAGFQPDPETGVPDFAGSPDYLYTRYRFQYRKSFRAGFTLEKDAGESLKKGPDFSSFHLMYTGKTWLRKVVVGDYQVLFGQGLTLWNGLAFGKSAFVSNVKRNGIGLRPYSSVQETNFLRGVATTVGVGRAEITPFFSRKKLDGNVDLVSDSTLTDDEFIVASLPVGGLHRTESEIAQKNKVTETTYGANVKFNWNNFSAGGTAVKTGYNIEVQPASDLYRLYRFAGLSNSNVGVDYQWVIRNTNVFGEFSRSENGGFSMINGLVAVLHPSLTVSLVHRHFGNDYVNLKANVFGENNLTANNERGLYFGVQANLNPKITFTGYADLVRYPWLRFRVDAPSVFTDYLAQINYKPDKKHEFYVRYRVRGNVQNSSDPDLMITYPVPLVQQNWRAHGVYQVHPNVQMKSRAEWTRFEKEGVREKGFVIYQDLVFKKIGSKASYTLRYALFDCKDWNSRIYAFETDVLYAFSILPYYGRGSRIYGMVKWDITRGMDLWVRYGGWFYTDRQVISSGNSEIQGNRKSDIHVQLRLQF